jgi:DNA-binding transcriptional LysR family regulator
VTLIPTPAPDSALDATGILDVSALRTFAAIADCGGFRRAADVLHLSPSAVSQHVRRLERTVGSPLVTRQGRETRFTPAGEMLLDEARRILAAHDGALGRLSGAAPAELTFVIGSTEHAADIILPEVAAALQRWRPGCRVSFRVDRGRRLNTLVDTGSIDVAVFLGDGDDDASSPAGRLPLAWCAAPGWQRGAALEPLSLVAIEDPCTIRRHALRTLAEHDIPTRVVCEAGYLAGVVNAARAGLGVALLAHVGVPPEGLEPRLDLPTIDPEPLHVRTRKGSDIELGPVVADAVRSLLAARATAH